jgi:hypothetical protein
VGRCDQNGTCRDGLNSTGTGQGLAAGCCECGHEPSGSCATELAQCRETTSTTRGTEPG